MVGDRDTGVQHRGGVQDRGTSESSTPGRQTDTGRPGDEPMRNRNERHNRFTVVFAAISIVIASTLAGATKVYPCEFRLVLGFSLGRMA